MKKVSKTVSGKKCLITVSFLGLLFFAVISSCSHLPQVDSDEAVQKTLRAQAAKLDKSIPWTAELEGNILRADITHTDGISTKVKVSPKSIVAGGQESSVEPVYPYLPGFGSLNTSKLSDEAKYAVSSFSDAVSKKGSADAFMADGCAYSLSLFYTDIAQILPQSKSDETVTEDKTIPADQNAPADESAIADQKAPVDQTLPAAQPAADLFASYIIGEPFTGDTVFQIPVRFITQKNDTVDVWLFLDDESGLWKIDQIQIRKWEITDGKQ
jgi:hypothetical protein